MNNDCKCNKPNTVGANNLRGCRLLAPKCCKGGVFFNTIVIPKSMGGSKEGEPFAPKNGMYYNALVRYEADNTKFIYDSEGNYTNLSNMSDEEIQEIVNKYIQTSVAFVFDTVADMKAATSLINGSYARTLGFRSVDDGGGALYRIVNTETANEMDIIGIGDLTAVLVGNKEYTAKQFGAYGDGTHDDTAYLQRAIDYVSSKKGKLTIAGGTYMVDALTSLSLKSNVELDFVNAKLKAITNDQTTYNILSIIGAENCVINDAVIEGEKDTHQGTTGEFGYGVNIRGATKNIVFNNLTVSNCWGDGIFFARVRENMVDYIPEKIYFNGTTLTENHRRQGVSIITGQKIYFDRLICRNISGTDPCAGIDIEPSFSVDLIGDIYINYLETDHTLKGFSMRLKSPLTGNVHVGVINHHNQDTIPYGLEGRYEHAFRVMFEYFALGQSKYQVSVDKVFAEHNTIQLENLYTDVTPRVIIGDVYVGEKEIISSASPTSVARSLLAIRYTLTTNLSNNLGGLTIGKYQIGKISSLTGATVNSTSPFAVVYEGETTLTDLSFSDTRVDMVEAIIVDPLVNWDGSGNNKSNVLCNNMSVNSLNTLDVYERRDSGAYNLITSGGNTVYFMPASDPSSSKTITLRVRNCYQKQRVKCVGNSTFNINTAHQTSYFTKVYLNGAEITGVDNTFAIGTFANGGEFIITPKSTSLYVEQIG